MDNIILTDAEDNDLTGIDFSNLTKKQISKKKYYEKNKEKILLDKAITIHCECGGRYPKQQKSVHFTRTKHKNFMLNKDKII